MSLDMLSFPGNTFLDMDCESSGYYEGKLPGTVSISGYSEEYRQHQILHAPILNLALESTETLPTMTLEKIVDRIRLLQRQPTLEDNTALKDILGLSQYVNENPHLHLHVNGDIGCLLYSLGGPTPAADRDKLKRSA